MTQAELDYFLGLKQAFRREAFMDAFWGPRDPDPRTPANELRDRWEEYNRRGGGLPFNDPRFMLYLLNGPPQGWTLPNGQPVQRCLSRATELEIWFYDGSERTQRPFVAILQRRGPQTPYELYLPGTRIRPMRRSGGLPTQDIQMLCAEDLLGYAQNEISRIAGYQGLLEEVLQPPLPSREWLANFSASDTELPEGAATFDFETTITFPARNQSRTAVQVLFGVPLAEAPGREIEGTRYHNFLLVGEVIKDGELFESFRYRFEGPTPADTERVPLGFSRSLRPGPVTLRVLLEDVYAKTYGLLVQELEVPSPEGLPAAPRPAVAATRGPSIKLYAPSADVVVGKQRFSARLAAPSPGGDETDVDKVTFYLDGDPVFSKRSPPYSVELDLGDEAAPHRVRVVAWRGEVETATDQIWLNQGAARFLARLVEPREDGIYPGSVTARAEVTTPGGDPPASVEIYLNDELAATLDAPPYVHALSLPPGGGPAVVRLLARLADGSTAEDSVLINTAGFGETVDVRLAQVPVLVTDREGRPLRDLRRENFRLTVDGAPRPIEGFEPPGETPLSVAVLIDRSISMEPHLEQVAAAAGAFVGAARSRPGDRTAIFSFADRMTVDVGFDGSAGAVERALAGLDAFGTTALHDAVAQSLATLPEGGGRRALLVFSDGGDESSRLTLEQTLQAARRSGAVIYALGLSQSFAELADREALEALARETGGRAIFLADLGELGAIYSRVLDELRARYLLAFSPQGDAAGEIRVEVDAPRARIWAPRAVRP